MSCAKPHILFLLDEGTDNRIDLEICTTGGQENAKILDFLAWLRILLQSSKRVKVLLPLTQLLATSVPLIRVERI